MAVSNKKNPKNGAYYWTHRVDGRLIRRDSKDWKSKKLAKADYDKFLKTLDEDGYQFKVTFNDLLIQYIEYCTTTKNKPSTVFNKKTAIDKHIRPFWGDLIVNKVKLRDLDKWQAQQLKATFKKAKNSQPELYSNRTIEKNQYLLSDIFDFAVTRDYMRKNLFDLTEIALHKQQKDMREVPLITLDQFEKLISVVDKEKYKALFSLSFWIGCRPGEALALNINDYDFKTKMLRVNQNWDSINKVRVTTKTDKNRDIYVPKQVRRHLEPYIHKLLRIEEVTTDMPLFEPHRIIGKSSIINALKRYCEDANIERIVPMSFRHSNVTLFAEKGLKDYEIASRTGHSVEVLNKHYKHIFEKRQKEINSKIDSI